MLPTMSTAGSVLRPVYIAWRHVRKHPAQSIEASHPSAIEMAKVLLQLKDVSPEIRPMAEKILADQQKEMRPSSNGSGSRSKGRRNE
jgi:hypothetical protein